MYATQTVPIAGRKFTIPTFVVDSYTILFNIPLPSPRVHRTLVLQTLRAEGTTEGPKDKEERIWRIFIFEVDSFQNCIFE